MKFALAKVVRHWVFRFSPWPSRLKQIARVAEVCFKPLGRPSRVQAFRTENCRGKGILLAIDAGFDPSQKDALLLRSHLLQNFNAALGYKMKVVYLDLHFVVDGCSDLSSVPEKTSSAAVMNILASSQAGRPPAADEEESAAAFEHSPMSRLMAMMEVNEMSDSDVERGFAATQPMTDETEVQLDHLLFTAGVPHRSKVAL